MISIRYSWILLRSISRQSYVLVCSHRSIFFLLNRFCDIFPAIRQLQIRLVGEKNGRIFSKNQMNFKSRTSIRVRWVLKEMFLVGGSEWLIDCTWSEIFPAFSRVKTHQKEKQILVELSPFNFSTYAFF